MSVRGYYERYWTYGAAGRHGEVMPALARVIQQYLRPGMRCLDVGAGDAHTAGPQLSRLGCDYVGVEVARPAVEAARMAGFEVHEIEDASALPFSDESFDAAICLEVLEHLFQPQLATREVHRVLRPGGVLIATVPNVAYWRRRVDLAVLGRWNPLGDELAVQQPWRDPHIRFFNPGALRRLLVDSGFTAELVSGHGGRFVWDLPWFSERAPSGGASPLYARAEQLLPSLFGYRLHAVARKDLARRSFN